MVQDAPDYTKTVIATAVIEGVEVSVEAARAFWEGKTKKYNETTDAVSPTGTVLPVNTDLSRNGHDGYITNDAADEIEVQIEDPDDGYGDKHTLKEDETLDLFMLNIKNIKLTGAATCEYRALVV